MPGGFPSGLDICAGNDQGSVTASTSGTTLTAGGTANVKGSYTQLAASTPQDTCFAVLCVTPGNSNDSFLIDVAVGSSGNEVPVISNLSFFSSSNGNDYVHFVVPIQIKVGSRISARCQATTGSAICTMTMLLFDGSFTQTEGIAGYEGVGVSTSTSQGQTLNGTTANTKAAWTELVSAAARDYQGIVIIVQRFNANVAMIDIGVGGSGSEQVIVPNLLVLPDGSGGANNTILYLPISIPAGTRIAAREQTSNTNGQNIVALMGAYA